MPRIQCRDFDFFGNAVAVMLLCFVAVICGWGVIDKFFGYREVSIFIDQHGHLVAEWLADPNVHTFSLSHDPEDSATLLIRFDVEDKRTYEMIESDLDAAWEMRSPPRWETTMRSNETLGNNYGYSAWGMGLLAWGMIRLGIAAVASLLAFGVCVCLGLWFRRGRTTGQRC